MGVGIVIVVGIIVARHAATATAATTATAAAEHLHAFANHAQFTSFLTIGFPLIQFQSAFDQDWRPLAQVLTGDFRRAAPKRDVDKRCFFDPFAAGGFTTIVHGQRIVHHRGTRRGVSQFDVAGQITDQDDAIVAGHEKSLRYRKKGLGGRL
jgi:hypothetical protein